MSDLPETCGKSLEQCLQDLEASRSDEKWTPDHYQRGYDGGWNSALDMLRSVMVAHGIEVSS